MTELHIGNELTSRDTGDLMSVLNGDRLYIPTSRDYPRHREWLDSTEASLVAGSKGAFLARIDHVAVGAIVYRPDESDHSIVDIRNISIAPSGRGRLLGSFMLRQTEVEASNMGAAIMRVDTKLSNEAMIAFLINNGYVVDDVADLYGDDTGEDAILTKNVG